MSQHTPDQAQHELHEPQQTGDKAPFLERLLFSNRTVVLLLFLVATIFLGYHATKVRPDASFEKMIPTKQPYIANFLERKDDLAGLGNVVRITVETTEDDIFNKDFLKTLQEINDEVFYIPGVDRGPLLSLWSPNFRWVAVTEEGWEGGPVIPSAYDGSEASLEQVRTNVLRSGRVGSLVANDFKSTIVYLPLLDINPETGERLDYKHFSETLETLIRDKYQSDTVKIHITGFAKVVGDLIDGATQVVLFFAVAIIITLVLLYFYSRCSRSAIIPLLCSVIAVVWQMGLLKVLGYGLDPYSMLVPFLVFAIGISHGVQIINAMAIEALHGRPAMEQARRAFRALYIPGLTALISDGVGFLTLMVIQITVIQELAIAASVGVAVIILTNLVLLPLLMSYKGVSQSCVTYLESKRDSKYRLWNSLSELTRPKPARVVLVLAALGFVFGLFASQNLKIGDLDRGAPELRPDSRYNLDNAFLTDHYSTSTDVFVVMVVTDPNQCASYGSLAVIDQFQWRMENVAGVQSTMALVDFSKRAIAGSNEGSLKWLALSRNRYVTNDSINRAPPIFMNADCSLTPVMLFLDDHKAETLEGIVAAVEAFAAEFNTDTMQFIMGAGNAGIEAATNIVVAKSQYVMLAWVYGVVSLLVWLTFRSLRTVICIITPLALTSVLAQALMTGLDIGVKVATLPVIALGVGIGVDYGIYIYTKLQTYLAKGQPLTEAYLNTLKTTGKAVAFTGITLAIGVGTWVFSPIKFQADMGILLTFMFLWNMLGALVLLPALAQLLINVDKIRAKAVAKQEAQVASA